MQVAKVPAQTVAVLLLPDGKELPLPVAPADVPESVVMFLLRTVLRNSSGRDDDQDPYDVKHARFLGAALIALLDRDQPPAPRPRRRRPAADPTGMSALF
jgi:hypothetical protein